MLGLVTGISQQGMVTILNIEAMALGCLLSRLKISPQNTHRHTHTPVSFSFFFFFLIFWVWLSPFAFVP